MVDGRRGCSEIRLNVRLCRRTTVDLGVVVDECKILPLFICVVRHLLLGHSQYTLIGVVDIGSPTVWLCEAPPERSEGDKVTVTCFWAHKNSKQFYQY